MPDSTLLAMKSVVECHAAQHLKKSAISQWLVMNKLRELELELPSSVIIGVGIGAPSDIVVYSVTIDDVLETCWVTVGECSISPVERGKLLT